MPTPARPRRASGRGPASRAPAEDVNQREDAERVSDAELGVEDEVDGDEQDRTQKEPLVPSSGRRLPWTTRPPTGRGVAVHPAGARSSRDRRSPSARPTSGRPSPRATRRSRRPVLWWDRQGGPPPPGPSHGRSQPALRLWRRLLGPKGICPEGPRGGDQRGGGPDSVGGILRRPPPRLGGLRRWRPGPLPAPSSRPSRPPRARQAACPLTAGFWPPCRPVISRGSPAHGP